MALEKFDSVLASGSDRAELRSPRALYGRARALDRYLIKGTEIILIFLRHNYFLGWQTSADPTSTWSVPSRPTRRWWNWA